MQMKMKCLSLMVSCAGSFMSRSGARIGRHSSLAPLTAHLPRRKLRVRISLGCLLVLHGADASKYFLLLYCPASEQMQRQVRELVITVGASPQQPPGRRLRCRKMGCWRLGCCTLAAGSQMRSKPRKLLAAEWTWPRRARRNLRHVRYLYLRRCRCSTQLSV